MDKTVRSIVRSLFYKCLALTGQSIQEISLGGHTARMYARTDEEYKDLFRFESTFSEKSVYRTILNNATSGDVFYDIGSKIGVFSCLVGVANPNLEIVLFEPHPSNAERCRENLELNDIDGQVHEIILSDKNQLTDFFIDSTEPGTGSHSIAREGEDRIKVDMRRFDTFLEQNQISLPDIVKIDVEGAERTVLEGMENTLKNNPPRLIIVEIHTSIVGDGRQVESILREAGYSLSRLSERGEEYHIKAELN